MRRFGERIYRHQDRRSAAHEGRRRLDPPRPAQLRLAVHGRGADLRGVRQRSPGEPSHPLGRRRGQPPGRRRERRGLAQREQRGVVDDRAHEHGIHGRPAARRQCRRRRKRSPPRGHRRKHGRHPRRLPLHERRLGVDRPARPARRPDGEPASQHPGGHVGRDERRRLLLDEWRRRVAGPECGPHEPHRERPRRCGRVGSRVDSRRGERPLPVDERRRDVDSGRSGPLREPGRQHARSRGIEGLRGGHTVPRLLQRRRGDVDRRVQPAREHAPDEPLRRRRLLLRRPSARDVPLQDVRHVPGLAGAVRALAAEHRDQEHRRQRQRTSSPTAAAPRSSARRRSALHRRGKAFSLRNTGRLEAHVSSEAPSGPPSAEPRSCGHTVRPLPEHRRRGDVDPLAERHPDDRAGLRHLGFRLAPLRRHEGRPLRLRRRGRDVDARLRERARSAGPLHPRVGRNASPRHGRRERPVLRDRIRRPAGSCRSSSTSTRARRATRPT